MKPASIASRIRVQAVFKRIGARAALGRCCRAALVVLALTGAFLLILSARSARADAMLVAEARVPA